MKKAKKQEIYAFIDSQNLNLGVRSQGWELDFKRFRLYLKNKYKVDKAIIVSGDGDFYCLVDYLVAKDKLLHLLTPNKRYSSLLRKFAAYIVNLGQLKGSLQQKKTGIRVRSKP